MGNGPLFLTSFILTSFFSSPKKKLAVAITELDCLWKLLEAHHGRVRLWGQSRRQQATAAADAAEATRGQAEQQQALPAWLNILTTVVSNDALAALAQDILNCRLPGVDFEGKVTLACTGLLQHYPAGRTVETLETLRNEA